MAVREAENEDDVVPVRQRKAHKKSRLGYRSLGPINPGFKVPVVQPVKGGMGEIVLDDFALKALERFRKRTVFSVGTKRTRQVYSEGAFMLGLKYPFLMHVFIALAYLHDEHLNPNSIASHRTPLAFHWYQATALFNRRLATASSVQDPSKLPGPERDSLWTAGALLGAASFALLDVQNIDNVWPLKESDLLDLDWLKMSDGKKVVWNLADPTRQESIFHGLLAERISMPDGSKGIPPDVLPGVFYSVFNLDASSCASTNPYHTAASLLAQLLPREITDNTVIQFLSFLTQLDPRYRKLLEEKDPRAMVLLAWWYTKAATHSSWWMQRRSLVEGQAICMYLERYCTHVEGILELVEFPKRVFDACRGNEGMAAKERSALVLGGWVY
ncbi:sterol regulatory element-binding protein ecm22 [Fusarium sporotrichioides]|uniref:Sterol regulatory element-binding protein ecm22 n=1 Tax=Fusarium sporotrichioides TaxID=5514 RepID=A0A395RNP8_FUSSP|nr:sterol regulatory element-binding protein ecm22 [Fusarium sporotrichioides]